MARADTRTATVLAGGCLAIFAALASPFQADAQTPTSCSGFSGETPTASPPTNLRILAGEQLGWRMVLGGLREPLDTPVIRYRMESGQADESGLQHGDTLPVIMSTVTRKHDDVVVPNRFVSYDARVVSDQVHLKLCIDPEGMSPGIYLTSARIASPGITHSPVGLEVVLREPRLPLYLLVLVGSWLIGGVMLVAREPDLWHHRSRLSLLIISGVIASLAVSQSELFAAQDFGKSFQDHFQAFAASLGAFLLGEGVTGVAGSVTHWGRRDERKSQPS